LGRRGKDVESSDCLFLGVIGLFIGFGVGESSGLVAGFVTLGVYCFLCQFLLSRKNVNAYRKDWPVMLVLDAVVLVGLLIMVLVEKREVILSQGPGILLATCGGTYLGAVVASLTAKRMLPQS
jgi:hypothetical protein